MNIETTLGRARRRLATFSDTPDLDARWLLEHLLGVDSAYLIAHGDYEFDAGQSTAFDALIARRAGGEPLAYIVGRASFWTLDLDITPAVLIPRPDTETLVASALEVLAATAEIDIADLGTGSGAIALALAAARPRWQVLATDTSTAALACARANAGRLGLANVGFARGDWLAALAGARFDALVANPPYIAPDDTHLQAPELGFEPRPALVADRQGLAAIERIAAGAPAALRPRGRLLLEHGAAQGNATRRLLRAAGFEGVETRPDLAGRPRVSLGQRPA